MRILILVLIFVGTRFLAFSQGNLPLLTAQKINQIKDPNAFYPLFIEGDMKAFIQYIEGSGDKISVLKGNFASAKVKVKNIPYLMKQPFIHRVEDGLVSVSLMMDTALYNNNILPIHQAQSPLTKAYTGKNVVMGIIDDGIDWRHGDFKNADGSSRIHYIWDQNNASPSNAPLPYKYGQEWTKADINAATLPYMEPGATFSHGSNVTGIAAGNARASGRFIGIAPDAELIVVGANLESNFLYNVIDGIDYIFKKADAMGKPCVINTSLGDYTGSHDGRDIPAKMIDLMLEERKGRVIVAAAGNAGAFNYHLGYDVNADTSFTWFKFNAGNNGVYFDFWADTADFKMCNSPLAQTLPREIFMKFLNTIGIAFKAISFVKTNNTQTIAKNVLHKNGNFLGTMSIQIDLTEGRYRGQVYIVPNMQNLNWKFATVGSGRFDVWSHPGLTGSSSMVESGLPDTTVLPAIKFYKAPDNKKNTVSSWQCSDKVITVANYNNRNFYFDVDSIMRNTLVETGDLSGSSSHGPTRDNRTKPDVSATGNFVIAAVGLNTRASFMSNSNRFKIALGSWHSRNGGTSMASPQVAGLAALLLELNPNFGYREIKQLILKSARNDQYTTAVRPNNAWGFGKLDGFTAFTFPAVFGCMDTGSFNYKSNANIDDGSCIPKVYGCMDTGSINYNPKANISNNTCIKKSMDVPIALP
ncbi:MAG: S8 family serine peptidase [Bacteroidetes bacterium]|nr:S8 family serine peptidase [Bacteroidota bacterium]